MATEIIGSQLIAKTGVLTRRETETALWVAEGKTQPEIAQILGCAPSTVKTHIEHAMAKLAANNAPALVTRLWIAGVLKARAVSALLLMGLVVMGAINNVDQARLRQTRTGARPAISRGAGRNDSLDPADLGLLWS